MSPEILNALTGFFPRILPECILGVFACVLFLGSTWKKDRNLWGAVALVGVAAAVLAAWLTPRPEFASVAEAEAALFAGPVWLDPLAVFIKYLALAGIGVLILMCWDDPSDDMAGEFHGCLLLIAAGVCLTASANDLITLFLALELISIPTYILLYLPRPTDAAQEAAVKYFLLSVFSSAMLLFGFSYLYGLTGTTNLQGIMHAMSPGGAGNTDELKTGVALVALVMIVAGLGFKMTAVPFHFYAPDVYQGTTTGNAALLAFVPKIAGFVAIIRIFGFIPFEIDAAGGSRGTGPIEGRDLATLLWIIAAVTMTLGNVLALLQDNVKRMFAYSSVAHSGYMLVGLAAAYYIPQTRNPGMTRGIDTVLFYLVAYGAMTVGAFAVLQHLSTRQRPVETVDDLAGLSKSHPGIALVMALFLFSLIGIPPTPGFSGKFSLLFDAFSLPRAAADIKQANLFRILSLILVLNAAIASWYYLRLITVMYLRTSVQPLAKQKASPRLVAVLLCALVTLTFFQPRPLFNWAREAINGKVNVSTTKPGT